MLSAKVIYGLQKVICRIDVAKGSGFGFGLLAHLVNQHYSTISILQITICKLTMALQFINMLQ